MIGLKRLAVVWVRAWCLVACIVVQGVSPVGAEPLAHVGSAVGASTYGVTKIRFRPRRGHAGEMKGGRFVGSLTSATKDFETILEIADVPVEGVWSELVVPRDRICAFRFVKYHARNGVWADIAELEFYAGDRKLTGTPFGTTGQGQPENEPRRAFDGNVDSFYRGFSSYNQYVGLDLGVGAQIARPALSLPQGTYGEAQSVTLTCATPGARIIYSIDGWGRPRVGADGQPQGGAHAYTGTGVFVAKSAILQAIAVKPGLAPSTAAIAAYHIGAINPDAAEHATFHIGNSLTDTVNGWMEPLAASAGHKVRFYRFTIPGAPTDWLWDHPGTGFGEGHYRQAFLARAPLTDLVTQPFFGHSRSVDNEADYSGRFFDLARKHSPQIQMWLYVQWTGVEWDRDRWANGRTRINGKELIFAPPAKTWQAAVSNHVTYTERVREEMNKARTAEIKAGTCKPVRIIPGGLALAELKTLVDDGRMPGMTDFAATVFAGPGDIHLSSRGAYLIALVHYACIYGESPEGKVTAANSGLTPEQAKRFQQLAWRIVKRYQANER